MQDFCRFSYITALINVFNFAPKIYFLDIYILLSSFYNSFQIAFFNIEKINISKNTKKFIFPPPRLEPKIHWTGSTYQTNMLSCFHYCFYFYFPVCDRKRCENAKKVISTNEHCKKHLLACQNTQHLIL